VLKDTGSINLLRDPPHSINIHILLSYLPSVAKRAPGTSKGGRAREVERHAVILSSQACSPFLILPAHLQSFP
jgi:hypothetical protein